MRFLILSLILIFSACSSTAKDWGPWTRCGVAQDLMVWDFCNERLHGVSYHHRGLCYPALECRERKTILGNIRKEQRAIMLFCEWGDIQCMYSNGLFNKVIKNP